MDDPSGLNAQLEPLARALAATARRDAEAHLAAAHERAGAVREEADATARRILSKAEAEGESAAERESAHRLVAAKRQGRRRVLGAQRAAYEALIDATLAELSEAREGPEYVALQEKLARAAAAALGEGATVQHDPDDQGGLIAQSDGRSVNLTLPVLVRRCVTSMGKDVARLWK